MPVLAGLANLSSDNGVEHSEIGVEVCCDELEMRHWLVCTVVSILAVKALVFVIWVMPRGT